MTRPTAIYRPIERDVLLTDAEGHSVPVSTTDAVAIARHLTALDTLVNNPLFTARPVGTLSIKTADLLHLARDIDEAVAVPTIAAAMLDDARCR